MCGVFGLCGIGLVLGLVHGLYASFVQHRTIEDILSHSIPYYQKLGILGVVGFLLFLALLVSVIANGNHHKQTK